jgi:G3E family GTPase
MISVNFILGFLGAGKTTFIKSFLEKGILGKERIVLVVNDYGPENYDSQILKETGVDILEITNGCLCCSSQNGFQKALKDLSQRKDIDRIIIEPSGLFMPDQVIPDLMKAPLISSLKLEPVYVLVDMAFLSGITRAWPPFISRHIEIADFIILNKHEGVALPASERIQKQLRKVNHKARLLSFNQAIDQFKDKKSKLRHPYVEDLAGHWEVKFEVKTDNISFKDLNELKLYFESQTNSLLRAKGLVLIAGKKMFINYTQNNLEVTAANSSLPPSISCFYL